MKKSGVFLGVLLILTGISASAAIGLIPLNQRLFILSAALQFLGTALLIFFDILNKGRVKRAIKAQKMNDKLKQDRIEQNKRMENQRRKNHERMLHQQARNKELSQRLNLRHNNTDDKY